MKATLATLACLLTAGLVTAAEVVGNNTAVVISKDVVESNNGFQFLCVPVDGLDIADGATQQKIMLSTLLPPETLEEGTSVLADNGTRYVKPLGEGGAKTWVKIDGETTEAADLELTGGDIFWLKAPEATSVTSFAALLSGTTTVSSEEPTSIVFCGQNRNREAPAWSDLDAGKVTALKNDSSVAIRLEDAALAVGGSRSDDQILTIQANSSEYKIYYYREGKWKSGSKIMQEVTDAVIAPGEAFYYYKASN